MANTTLDRRSFMISSAFVSGAMVLWLAQQPSSLDAASVPERAPNPELSAWIVIAPDGIVTVRVPNAEVGNGTVTQIAMYFAEELCCDWTQIRAEAASIRRDFLEGGIYNVGLRPFFSGGAANPDRMRHMLQLGASARERLKIAAATRWGVGVSEVQAAGGVLSHPSSGRKLPFGEVVADAAKVVLRAEPRLKSQSEWTLLSKTSPSRLNNPDIVTGRSVYGIDVQVPGMCYAALKQAPVQGGRLKSHDPRDVLKMPGVRAVVVVDPSKTRGSPIKPQPTFGFSTSRTQSGIAVIADHYWQAKKALELLPVEWDHGAGAGWVSSDAIANAQKDTINKGLGDTLQRTGDVASIVQGRVVEAAYSTPLCENAALEPLNGTALVDGDHVEAWLPTQDQLQAFWVTVDESGVAPEKVTIHPTFVGGGFGRRSHADDVRMVIAVAKEYPGVPVKVIWSREETMRQGRYRSMAATQFRAVLDSDTGIPKAVSAESNMTPFAKPNPGDPDVISPAMIIGFGDVPYFTSGMIPNVHLRRSELRSNILMGAYRGPFYNSNAFIVETFIDECAAVARIDPLEYRLRLLGSNGKSWSDCLRAAAAHGDWGKPLPKGEGRGIAISKWSGTTVAVVAHVRIAKDRKIDVRQLDVAFDCGRLITPEAVRAQIEGGVLFGLNMALNEEITIKDGAVVEGNFDTYPMIRMADVPPRINVHFDALSNSGDYGGVGETPVGPVGPAIGNAIFQATGTRLRSTPFRKHYSAA